MSSWKMSVRPCSHRRWKPPPGSTLSPRCSDGPWLLEICWVAAYDLSCVFHIFHRPAREFPGRIDPSDGFRERRQRRRCQTRRRRVGAVLVVVIAAVAMTFGFRAVTAESGPAAAAELAETASQSAEPTELAATASEPAAPQATELPQPVRGVHVTMSLMTLPGKLDEYLSLTDVGLNTLQIDIKDEQGRVAFSPGQSHLAREIGAVGDFYNAEDLVAKVDAAGAFLVARLVVFQDSVLAAAKPKLSIKRRGGGNWVNDAGLGWTNPYDETVWAYNVDIAIAAAEAGFDEIMFDYIRFPTDGDLSTAVYRGERPGPKADAIAQFLAYAKRRLDPYGVKVGAAIFGLAATRNIGIGQAPRKMARSLDVVHPMVYPSAYGAGECNIDNPVAAPGRIVSCSLQDFRQVLTGRDVAVVPWLQDYGGYTIDELRAQVAAAERWQSDGYLLWNSEGVYTDGALNIR
jgi:hypothetical protein